MTELKPKTAKIEKSVVDAYKKVEETVVGTYQKIEDKFVETFLEEKENNEDK